MDIILDAEKSQNYLEQYEIGFVPDDTLDLYIKNSEVVIRLADGSIVKPIEVVLNEYETEEYLKQRSQGNSVRDTLSYLQKNCDIEVVTEGGTVLPSPSDYSEDEEDLSEGEDEDIIDGEFTGEEELEEDDLDATGNSEEDVK